jgi:hypothetical protein
MYLLIQYGKVIMRQHPNLTRTLAVILAAWLLGFAAVALSAEPFAGQETGGDQVNPAATADSLLQGEDASVPVATANGSEATEAPVPKGKASNGGLVFLAVFLIALVLYLFFSSLFSRKRYSGGETVVFRKENSENWSLITGKRRRSGTGDYPWKGSPRDESQLPPAQDGTQEPYIPAPPSPQRPAPGSPTSGGDKAKKKAGIIPTIIFAILIINLIRHCLR